MTPDTGLIAAVEVLSARAMQVREKYVEFERRTYGHEWSTSDLMAGLVVDVGDLTRLVMASQGSRVADHVDEGLAHELSDCLWSVLVLARRLDIDLGAAFVATMDQHRPSRCPRLTSEPRNHWARRTRQHQPSPLGGSSSPPPRATHAD